VGAGSGAAGRGGAAGPVKKRLGKWLRQPARAGRVGGRRMVGWLEGGGGEVWYAHRGRQGLSRRGSRRGIR
jgi:hypothetical protein